MILLHSSSSFILCSGTQLCLTLCDPMDLSSPGSSVHGILQARILEWTPFLLQRILLTQGSSLRLLYWQEGFFLTTEPPGKPK